MKAMIFAAGLGTRLKPLTNTMPKALVPVGGKPLLQHIIEKLKSAGFNEIIINVHHFAEQIIDFVETNRHFGIHIEFSDECRKLLDTGGGIKKTSAFFNDNQPFLVHNVDILSNIDLQKLYKTSMLHAATPQSAPPLATLVCSERKTSRYLLFDSNNRLKGWINEQTGEVKSPFPHLTPQRYRKLAFAGIQVLHPSVFQYMTAFPDSFSIIEFYLSLCNKEELTCYIPNNLQLIDAGKTDSLKDAAQFVETSPPFHGK